MSKDIRIPKGLTIKLKGTAERRITDLPVSEVYTIAPPELHGLIPRLHVKIGDSVLAGDTLFSSKLNENIKIASPVSGTILDLVRGEKRRVLSVKIKADSNVAYKDFGVKDYTKMSVEELKNHFQ